MPNYYHCIIANLWDYFNTFNFELFNNFITFSHTFAINNLNVCTGLLQRKSISKEGMTEGITFKCLFIFMPIGMIDMHVTVTFGWLME